MGVLELLCGNQVHAHHGCQKQDLFLSVGVLFCNACIQDWEFGTLSLVLKYELGHVREDWRQLVFILRNQALIGKIKHRPELLYWVLPMRSAVEAKLLQLFNQCYLIVNFVGDTLKGGLDLPTPLTMRVDQVKVLLLILLLHLFLLESPLWCCVFIG